LLELLYPHETNATVSTMETKKPLKVFFNPGTPKSTARIEI